MALSTDSQAAAAQETADGTLVGRNTTSKVGFFGTTPVGRATVTGSKGSNAALTSLIAALVAQGLIIDSTS